MLSGRRFIRLFPRVWVTAAHEMSERDRVSAARLSLPEGAQPSHSTRLRLLGYDDLAELPYHFVIDRDQKIVSDHIRLHRTILMPSTDADGVTPAAAFVQSCETMRLIDLIKIGDWLLHEGHASLDEIGQILVEQSWRPGASQCEIVLPLLDARSRSPKESEVRAILSVVGLPLPDVNVDLVVKGRWLGCVDLLYLTWLYVVEYEGRQHAFDTAQFNGDIGRYGRFRRNDVTYLQVTQEKLARPRALVREVHADLVALGYEGPPPVFGRDYRALFRKIRSRRP
ncbi:hypothetical protein FE697_005790 [Mumia zhuanghuii]|uniref:DUF559 domain-containing protein n=2 Tax=Mumia TaxID=1546255 RepID=A0ABW1QK69_9ACTN|nr:MULTISPECIES: hypothetical protein [Mumia]KAA1425362.1 hypothetical protein FE697_005790 [Mumia zhuanghuii]